MGEELERFLKNNTMIEKSGNALGVYELSAESKCKNNKERKKHYMDLSSKNF